MFVTRLTRPLMAKVKETTGIVGLDVVPNAREVLMSLDSKNPKRDSNLFLKMKAIERLSRVSLVIVSRFAKKKLNGRPLRSVLVVVKLKNLSKKLKMS
ncbi:putative NADH dehydrogenase [ubiquinone] 1 alpha subcomplex subunit 5 mitochondrial [Bienertia sinuspersici]